MSKIQVDAIEQQSGTTLTTGGGASKTVVVDATTITLGRCGGTVALASGASQSGFGRTGTVDWQTTPKTGNFTGANGEGYFINTTSGTITMTLPSASAGDIISIQDYNNTFDSNSFTIQAPSGVKINGGTAAGRLALSTEGQGLTLIYVDATVGWRSIESTTFNTQSSTPTFITATGGTITTVCTNFKVHTFTGPGTFTVCSVGNPIGSNTVDYMVVAGGAAGGGAAGYGGTGAGAGGAGGYRESPGTASGGYSVSPLGASPAVALPVTATGFPITVGAAGSVGPNCSKGGDGSNSVFSTITSTGGGGGGGAVAPNNAGRPGGSGGGSSCAPGLPNVGAGNTPPVSPPQGNPGGVYPGTSFGSGGGGATTAGFGEPKVGGTGATSSINGTPTARAGGGGGGGGGSGQPGPAGPNTGGAGGSGGGGAGGNPSGGGTPGTTNTGGGGGGGPVADGRGGGNGGSGIVIVRYKFQ